MQITNDLQKLLDILPENIRQSLENHPQQDSLIEVVLDLGRCPEARFPNQAEYICEAVVTREQLQECIQKVGTFGGDNRAGIEQTLHRISAIRNRTGEIIGLTCRVGRAVQGTIATIRDLVETGQSILMLGRPGVGKTTALREIARVIADELDKRVVIIDTSNEIAGDGDIPHPAIGRARRMQVARPELQHQVMIEAVENHMPEVIVIDEIGTELEALAARTIAERGVQLVGTAHGNEIENLIKNPTLSDLVGGIQSVTLGDDEARRRQTRKTVLERKAPPTFEIAVEMSERQCWVVHESVAETVDNLLRGYQPNPQVRTINDLGQVTITREIPSFQPQRQPSNLGRGSGRVIPFRTSQDASSIVEESEQANDRSLKVYPYGISRHQLEEAIAQSNLPIASTRDIENADAILAIRSHARKHFSFRRMVADHPVPVYTIKANTTKAIARALQSCLAMDEPDTLDVSESSHHGRGDSEVEALEEAKIAIEQVVIPKGQPVELLPRATSVRKMQHELVEHYHLKSESFGREPHRRLRIYPA